MRYKAHTSFELVQPGQNDIQPGGVGTPIDTSRKALKVAGNGANRIQFIAMPMSNLGRPNWGRDAVQGVNVLLNVIAYVNGFPLIPTVLDWITPAQIVAGQPYFNLPAAGDRLDFNHGVGVEDHTVYNVEFNDPTAEALNLQASVMVIRTFISPID